MQTPSAEAEPALRNGGGSVRRGSAQRDRGVRRASLLDHARPNAPPLAKLRRSLTSDRSASFGSIRFPARTMPAKFVHLAPDSDAGVVVRLLVDTWKLANPCAVLALSPPSAGPMAPMTPMAPANKADEVNSRLMLRSKLTPDEVNIKLRSGWAEHVKSAVLEVPSNAVAKSSLLWHHHCWPSAIAHRSHGTRTRSEHGCSYLRSQGPYYARLANRNRRVATMYTLAFVCAVRVECRLLLCCEAADQHHGDPTGDLRRPGDHWRPLATISCTGIQYVHNTELGVP